MNAKEMFLFELGDFGIEKDGGSSVAEDSQPQEKPVMEETGFFETDENGKLVGFEDVLEEDVLEEELEDSKAKHPELEDEDEDDDGVPSIFDDMSLFAAQKTEEESAPDDGINPADLTPEERTACIEAASEAMTDRRMPQEIFNWGFDYITKMGKANADDLRARFDALDKDALKAEMERRDAEEDEQEAAEMTKYLDS